MKKLLVCISIISILLLSISCKKEIEVPGIVDCDIVKVVGGKWIITSDTIIIKATDPISQNLANNATKNGFLKDYEKGATMQFDTINKIVTTTYLNPQDSTVVGTYQIIIDQGHQMLLFNNKKQIRGYDRFYVKQQGADIVFYLTKDHLLLALEADSSFSPYIGLMKTNVEDAYGGVTLVKSP
jgi:hypothetical protein